MSGRDTVDLSSTELLEANSLMLTLHTYLHEEPSQQGSFDVVGVGFGSERGLRDGELDPVQSVIQL